MVADWISNFQIVAQHTICQNNANNICIRTRAPKKKKNLELARVPSIWQVESAAHIYAHLLIDVDFDVDRWFPLLGSFEAFFWCGQGPTKEAPSFHAAPPPPLLFDAFE